MPSEALNGIMLSVFCGMLIIFTFLSLTTALLKQKRIKVFTGIIYSFTILSLVLAVYGLGTLFQSPLSVVSEDGTGLSLIAETNPDLLSGLNEVNLVKFDGINKFKHGKTTVATYYAMDRALTIPHNVVTHIDEAPVMVEEIWWHELGHHIWFWHMSDQERQAFEGIHARDWLRVEHEEFPYFPTNYSKTNVREDFAESFSRWVIDWDMNRQGLNSWNKDKLTEKLDPARVEIIDKVIKRLTNCTYEEGLIQKCIYRGWVQERERAIAYGEYESGEHVELNLSDALAWE